MQESTTLRILDAALNRAAEGLRVVEDYARLALDDPFLAGLAKSLRHDLAAAAALVPTAERHVARDTLRDVGTEISTPSEGRRADAWDVCVANLKRAQQSLRSLEEYGKLLDADFARQIELLRYSAYTLEKAIDMGRDSRQRLAGVRLCVLVDGQESAAKFEKLVTCLSEAGVGMIQLRDKRLEGRTLLERARLLVALTKEPAPGRSLRGSGKTLAIINDRADIAAAAQADGVHLGQEDLPVKEARAIVGPRMLIGVSTHNLAQARAAVLDGANYLGAGPTFPSTTKSFGEFAGLAYLGDVAAEIRLPTFAIGGIDADNLADVLATGVSRVAVGAAVTQSADPAQNVRSLLELLGRPVAEPTSASLAPDS